MNSNVGKWDLARSRGISPSEGFRVPSHQNLTKGQDDVNSDFGKNQASLEKIPQRLLKTSQAAKYLCLSQRTLWNLVKAGQVPAVRVGPKILRFDLSDLDTFVSKCKGGAA